jgi:hypothetical protein
VTTSTSPAILTYSITANGTPMGDYQGATEAEALDAYARDAGYSDLADLNEQHPNGRDDAGVTASLTGQTTFHKHWDLPMEPCDWGGNCGAPGVAVERITSGEHRETRHLCESHVKRATSVYT